MAAGQASGYESVKRGNGSIDDGLSPVQPGAAARLKTATWGRGLPNRRQNDRARHHSGRNLRFIRTVIGRPAVAGGWGYHHRNIHEARHRDSSREVVGAQLRSAARRFLTGQHRSTKRSQCKRLQVISPSSHGNLGMMNKRLETLLDRISTWPQEAQDWAVLALTEVEEKVRILQSLTSEERAKLAALRETINRSIERGGSYTDEEVAAHIEQVHAEAEREGR